MDELIDRFTRTQAIAAVFIPNSPAQRKAGRALT